MTLSPSIQLLKALLHEDGHALHDVEAGLLLLRPQESLAVIMDLMSSSKGGKELKVRE
jgi:hypothetical protein